MPKHFAAAFSLLATSTVAAIMPRHAARMILNAKNQIQRRPALAHGIVGFVLFGASDAFAQQIEASVKQGDKMTTRTSKIGSTEETSGQPSCINFSMDHFDMIRFLSAGTVGAFFGGCVYPFAYKRLDLIWKGKDVISIAKKSLLEVFTVGIFANSVSMGARGLLTGKNPIEVLSHVWEEMRDVTFNDLRVWFPYNVLAFGFIPISIRPATTSLMESAWQTYISLRSNAYETNHTQA